MDITYGPFDGEQGVDGWVGVYVTESMGNECLESPGTKNGPCSTC